MVHLSDVHGKYWTFKEAGIEEIYFDNTHANNWCIIVVNGARIKTFKWALALALPHVTEDMPLKL